MERIATALPGSVPRRPVAYADADGLAGQLTSAPSAPVASQTVAARALVGMQRPPSVPALCAQAHGRTHTAIGDARASAGDTGFTRRRSQRWTSIQPAPGRAPRPAADGPARQRGVPPTPAQDIATQARLGLRMRTRPRRFSITHPQRPRTSDPVVAALSFDNEEVRMWGDIDMNTTGMATWTAELLAAHPIVDIQPGSPQGSNLDVAAFLLGLPQAPPARTSAAGA
jgi:hypothetical protein